MCDAGHRGASALLPAESEAWLRSLKPDNVTGRENAFDAETDGRLQVEAAAYPRIHAAQPRRSPLHGSHPNSVSIDLSYGTIASTVTAAQQIMPASQANERTTGILSQ